MYGSRAIQQTKLFNNTNQCIIKQCCNVTCCYTAEAYRDLMFTFIIFILLHTG